MTDVVMKRASLVEIRWMKAAGELHVDPAAPESEDLGPEFWAKVRIEGPKRTRSVHLKLDPEVFEYFLQVTGGKGYLARMQAVLKAMRRRIGGGEGGESGCTPTYGLKANIIACYTLSMDVPPLAAHVYLRSNAEQDGT